MSIDISKPNSMNITLIKPSQSIALDPVSIGSKTTVSLPTGLQGPKGDTGDSTADPGDLRLVFENKLI